jgi:hypothetical protein
MARMNDDAQWIMLMALVVCVALFFLAYLMNESVLVGKTTAESALDFPKSDIRDIKTEIIRWNELKLADPDKTAMIKDIEALSFNQKNSIVNITENPQINPINITIHYNNGLLQYDETIPL